MKKNIDICYSVSVLTELLKNKECSQCTVKKNLNSVSFFMFRKCEANVRENLLKKKQKLLNFYVTNIALFSRPLVSLI